MWEPFKQAYTYEKKLAILGQSNQAMYLSKIEIENFRGIENLSVKFNSEINIIIGENGCNKTALIDAIRLLYNVGHQQKDIFVCPEDFHTGKEIISIAYYFKDLSDLQKGAFHEFLVLHVDEKNDFIKVRLSFRKEGSRIIFNCFAGDTDDFRPSPEAFTYFKHCYLSALRDSTRALLNNRNNILGNLISKQVERNKSHKDYEDLIRDTNDRLLEFAEVVDSRSAINLNLERIYKTNIENQIGLLIETSKVDNILNIIKPYLPYDKSSLNGEGFSLKQNSLGFNNLIYIATILGDINEGTIDDKISHYCLLIEEPEAHLHPQLQVSLFEFLKDSKVERNSQLFITTHSPTLTSKVPLDNLLFMNKAKVVVVGDAFENEIPGTNLDLHEDDLDLEDPSNSQLRKAQLERYIDVTKSQLFFAKGVIYVEGISEELLLPVFSQILKKNLVDYRIEIVNIGGTSFYPFLSLYISPANFIEIPAVVLTDDDRFPASKDSKFSFTSLVKDAEVLKDLRNLITTAIPTKRLDKLAKFVMSSYSPVKLATAYKTFEFELIKSNVSIYKNEIEANLLVKFIFNYIASSKVLKLKAHILSLTDILSLDEHFELCLLIWKALPPKALFAQDLSIFLQSNIVEAGFNFNVPDYISMSLESLIPSKSYEVSVK